MLVYINREVVVTEVNDVIRLLVLQIARVINVQVLQNVIFFQKCRLPLIIIADHKKMFPQLL